MYRCYGAILNNTICGNWAGDDGSGFYKCSGTIINCIVWGNSEVGGVQVSESDTITYSCIEGWTGVDSGNINSDPVFAGFAYDSATWTADAVYDSSTFQSTLIDTGAGWVIDSLAGMFVKPDTGSVFQYLIVSNTDTTITVWCDLSDSVSIGDNFEIYDYRLATGSPCIDAGDSTVDAGEYDVGGNFRYVSSKDKAGWDGDIAFLYENGDGDVTLAWKYFIDMGAYEYQAAYTTEIFTIQAREAMDAGEWSDIFSGNVGTWTDTGSGGFDSRFYRVMME